MSRTGKHQDQDPDPEADINAHPDPDSDKRNVILYGSGTELLNILLMSPYKKNKEKSNQHTLIIKLLKYN
jgi:hypothetical protein